jgi:hypothetical protein
MATVLHPAPRFASNDGVKDTLAAALGDMLLASKESTARSCSGSSASASRTRCGCCATSTTTSS